MVITDRFVYIHQPKTGGTFVSEIIRTLFHVESLESVRFSSRKRKKVLSDSSRFTNILKHGTCNDIPDEFKGRTIVATVRNPYDRYVSQYEFQWWKKFPKAMIHSNADLDEIRRKYSFPPKLSFEEFLDFANDYFPVLENTNFVPEKALGWQTEQFVRYFFKNPTKKFPRINDEYIESGDFSDDLHKVHFLRTHRLNHDLHNFLESQGYPKKKIEFILDAHKIYPPEGGRKKDNDWTRYYSPELKQRIRIKERLLFKLFPDFDL